MQQTQQFVCNGDCKKCKSMHQWSFCASVHAFSNMKVLDKVMETLSMMQGEVKELAEKIEAIQNSEAAVFDPNEATELYVKELAAENQQNSMSQGLVVRKETAQEEDGAENRSSHK